MKIGVLGANGFVGRNLCSFYLKKGCEVYAFYNSHRSNIPQGCNICSLNQSQNITLDFLFVAIGNYTLDAESSISLLSSLNIFLNSTGFKKIIFISSTAVYGEHDKLISVNSSFNQPALYGQSKIAQELIIQSQDNYAIIRPTYLYGDDMNVNSLIPLWIESAKLKRQIKIYGNGSRVQDYLHIDDLLSLCDIVANDIQNTITLAASGFSISNLELANYIKIAYPGTEIQLVGEDNASSFRYDISDAKKRYNWEPTRCLKKWLVRSE